MAERTGQSNSSASIQGQCLAAAEEHEGTHHWREEVGESRRGATGLQDIDRVLEKILVSSMCHDLREVIVSQSFSAARLQPRQRRSHKRSFDGLRVPTSVKELLRRLIKDVIRRMFVRVTKINLSQHG